MHQNHEKPFKHEAFIRVHHGTDKFTCSLEAFQPIVFCRAAVPSHLHDRAGCPVSLTPCNRRVTVTNHVFLCLFIFSWEVWPRICWEFVAHSNQPCNLLDRIFSLSPSTVLCLNWLQIHWEIPMKKSLFVSLLNFYKIRSEVLKNADSKPKKYT